MFKNKVYKCDLLSITPDIRVNVDKNIRSNIKDADTEVISTIFVQPTWNPSYMKEIITKRIIPVYRIEHYETSNVLNGQTYVEVPKSPCFIKYNVKVGDEDLWLSDDLVVATPDEVKDYINRHPDKETYAFSLYEIFKRGVEYYYNSKEKGIVSDEKQIKKMLKKLKK